jgi:hypothetical protein
VQATRPGNAGGTNAFEALDDSDGTVDHRSAGPRTLLPALREINPLMIKAVAVSPVMPARSQSV